MRISQCSVEVPCFVLQKYRNLSVLLTEQINLYLRMEEKPEKVSCGKNSQIYIRYLSGYHV
jgi:hypothetical protein